MGMIDFGKFRIPEESIQAIGDILRDDFLESPEFGAIHNIIPGIVAKSQMGFFGRPGMVGVKRQGCNPVPQQWGISERTFMWDPQPWEILLAECFTNLENNVAVYALELGKDIADLTATEWAAVISELLVEAMKEFFWRMFWFNELDMKHQADGGILAPSYTDDNGKEIFLDVAYFNILNGFFRQIEELASDRPDSHVSISKNAGSTYDAQKLDSGEATAILDELYFGSVKQLKLRGSSGAFLLTTQSIADAYARDLSEKCCNIETYNNMVNGVSALKYQGMPLIPMPIWDEMIMNFFNTGTKLIDPHRAVFTTKQVLGIGVDKESAFEEFNMWYNKDTRETKVEAMGKADAKLLNLSMVRSAR